MNMTTPTEVLCRNFPNEFAIYLNYTRSLRFDDKPDYSYLRKIFRDLFVRESFQYDYVFDWTVYKYQKNSEGLKNNPNATPKDESAQRNTNVATAGIPTPQIQSTASKPFADSTNRRKKITGRGDDFATGEGDRM